MTFGGIIVLIISIGGTSGFFFWCIYHVLTTPHKTEEMHGVLDTELSIEERERRHISAEDFGEERK